MNPALQRASCARIPAGELSRLGGLRARADVRVTVEAAAAWVFWPAPDGDLAAWLLALPGAELFVRDRGHWRRLDRQLPIFNVPDPQTARPLSALLFPAPVTPISPGQARWTPLELSLVTDDRPRQATALRLPFADLLRWAETATSHSLMNILVARHADEVLVRGRLPALLGERFWGTRVLVLAGWRPEPALAEATLADALRLTADDLAVWTPAGVEVLPKDAFGRVTRSSLRRAGGGATHAR